MQPRFLFNTDLTSSVGQVFEFCCTRWFQVFGKIQNQRIVGSGYLKKKKADSKNHQVWVVFKNFKELPGFVKEPTKTQQF
jgi:hypothetical protein